MICLAGIFLKERAIRGPAVPGRAGGKMWATTSYNSGFTHASSRWSSAGLSATSSSVTPLAEGRSASVVPSLLVRKPAGR